MTIHHHDLPIILFCIFICGNLTANVFQFSLRGDGAINKLSIHHPVYKRATYRESFIHALSAEIFSENEIQKLSGVQPVFRVFLEGPVNQ